MACRYRWDDFVLDLDAYRLERQDEALALEPKALELLALMVERPQHLFTKQEIFERVWPGTAVTDHALTRVIAQLRRVLGDDSREPRYIQTVPSKGYRWVAPIHAEVGTVATGVRAFENTAEPTSVPTAAPVVVSYRAPGLAAVLVVAVLAILGITAVSRLDSRGSGAGMNASTGAAAAAVPDALPVRWPVQLTTHGGLDVQPDLSPLGDAVAYVSDRSGAFEIYVRAFGGTSRDVPITSDGGQNVQPAWSPDGRFLAYHSFRHGGIWVVPSRGGIPRQLAPVGSKPAWSPDGRHIAFQSDEQLVVTPTAYGAQHGSTIRIIEASGGHEREVTRAGQPLGGHAAPVWSPDGRYVAFTVFEGGADDGIWIVTPDTQESRPMLRRGRLFELAFAPDGTALYATSGEAAILRLPFDPGTGSVSDQPAVIPIAGVPGVRGLSISADGARVAFAGIVLSSQIWAQSMKSDGSPAGPAHALTNNTSYRNSVPVVSPDGARVAYMSRRAGEPPHVEVMDVDGRNGMQVTGDDSKYWLAAWFADSRRLAYLSRRGSSTGLWAVDIVTRREELMSGFDPSRIARTAPASPHGQVSEFELAPSMKRVAFSMISPSTGRRGVYVTSTSAFAPRAVTEGAVSVGYPAWSPDERRLAVEIKDGSSMHAGVVDMETQKLRRLTNERGQTWTRSWSPDGRRIAVAALRNGHWDLRWIDAETGEQKIITPAGPTGVYVRYPEWSPRGDVVVFERGEVRGNIWTLTLK